jgi:aryl-alcohol dehydrogenase-like predicted oxidoreductase
VALTQAESDYIAQLETLGETQVRSDLNHGRIPPAFVHLASTWLAGKDREAERRTEASNSEQMELMRRASAAAERQATAVERANNKATIALAIAIASMVITIIGIGVTHWDAYK